MQLRSKLLQLGLGTVIPPILLAAVLGGLLINYEREAYRRGATDRNRAFMTAVDTEIRGHMLTLNAMSASRNLHDLRKFHEEMLLVLASQSDWQTIHLALPSGQHVINTNRPFGSKLPVVLEMQSITRLLETKRPAIGEITVGPVTKRAGIPVRIPIMENAAVVYVLTAVINPGVISRLIEAQRFPPTWTTAVVDATGHYIARAPARSVGELAGTNLVSAVERGGEGWYRGITKDGSDSYTAYKTSDFTHWTVGVAVPASEVNAAGYRAAWLIGLGTLLTIGIALAYAYSMGRRISSPMMALAAAARSMGTDKEPAHLTTHSEIREVRDVAQALTEASTAIRERQVLIEREQSILKAADKAKDEFLAMLGHELRNPLSAVSNAAALLNRPTLPPEHRLAAQAIVTRQTDQLTHMVNDLLDVGRVVAGKIHLEQTRVDLSEVADAAVHAIRAAGRAESHNISVRCPDPVYVFGDPTRLEQVITNLLSNAITHTPPNGSIDISVVKESGSAVLRVADTGAGLKEEDRAPIFELFYQADKALHRKGGLGIGLTLVKRLVEMHGGIVSAFSAGLGKGSTFTVRLPLSSAPTQANVGKMQGGPSMSSLNVLVIDDSEDVRSSMQLLLKIEGHVVHVAEDGHAGLEKASSVAPDIALVDIGMPGMDGYEVARQMRARFGDAIALIALTGYGQPDDVRRAIDAGFDEHVVKPADFPSLMLLMTKTVLRSRRAAAH